MDNHFEDIFALMEISFPKEEYRNYENQKRLLLNEKYKTITELDDKNNLLGFILYWELKNFNFIEHFAVNPNTRGKGIGSKMLKDFIEKSKNTIILEVEIPKDEISKKRIHFYEKNGFFLNKYNYFQKPLRKNTQPQKMYLMSYPKEISKEEFENIKSEIYKYVYTQI